MSYPATASGRSMKRVEREYGMPDPDDREPLLSGRGKAKLTVGEGVINKGTMEGASKKSRGTGNVATFFNFAKASVGSGSFALSWGILQAGVLVGAAGMVLLGIASVYTMQLMLEIKRHIQDKGPSERRRSLNYTEIGYVALGPFGKWAVNIAVLGCNLGVCAGYMIFISINVRWVINCISVRAHHVVCFSTWEVYAILLPILILLTFLPSFRFLAFAAYVGSIFLVIAMIVVYVYGIGNDFCAPKGYGGDIRYLPKDWTGVAQWFGVTAFLFCVHSMVIPLESVMKKPKKMPMILDIAALVVVGVNLPFALYGYLLFGEETQGYIFSNLPGNWFNTIVRAFLSIELTLTFPIVIKPATDVMEEIWKNILMFFSNRCKFQEIEELYESPRMYYKVSRTIMVFVLRGFLVLASWGVAVGIPRFELCLALVGSLATTILAFILPPLFHLRVMWRATSPGRNLFHVVLLVIGILITVGATSINLYMAIKGGPPPPECGEFKTFCVRSFIDNPDHCYTTINN